MSGPRAVFSKSDFNKTLNRVRVEDHLPVERHSFASRPVAQTPQLAERSFVRRVLAELEFAPHIGNESSYRRRFGSASFTTGRVHELPANWAFHRYGRDRSGAERLLWSRISCLEGAPAPIGPSF
jgi:hypothetical protein